MIFPLDSHYPKIKSTKLWVDRYIIIYIYIPLCFHEISRCFKRFLVGRGADARHDGEPAQLGRAGASGASCHWF